MSARAALDFYFFVGSLYSYSSVMRIGPAAERAGVAVRWRAFNLRAILAELGPAARSEPKIAYIWRDIERRAARYGLPYTPRPPYPVDPELLANRVAALACAEGWGPEFAKAQFEAWFVRQDMPGDRAALAALLAGLGRDAETVLSRAEGGDAARPFDRATEDARALGIFGAPTFAVGEEIFWGDDRLEDALDWAAQNQGA